MHRRYDALRFALDEHRASRPRMTRELAEWCRTICHSVDRINRGFVPLVALPRVLAAANCAVGNQISLARYRAGVLPTRLSMLHVSQTLIGLLTEP